MGTEADLEKAWPWTPGGEMAARVERSLSLGMAGVMGSIPLLWLLHGMATLPLGTAAWLALLFCLIGGLLFDLAAHRDEGNISVWGRSALYLTVNSAGIAIGWIAVLELARLGTGDYLVAALLGAALAVAWNFLLNLAITWNA